MPQLAPVNWLFLFMLFWFVIILGSTLIWWSFKTEYKLPVNPQTPTLKASSASSNSWNW